jgi:hypothetical protein
VSRARSPAKGNFTHETFQATSPSTGATSTLENQDQSTIVMYKRSLSLGLVSGLLSGLASVIYQHVYNAALGADFSSIVSKSAIVGGSIFGGLLAAITYVLFGKWFKTKADRVFNLVFVILCIVTTVLPFAFRLPLTVQSPELFPGMTIPMHLFLPLAWLSLRPFFFKDAQPLQTVPK